MTLLNERYTAAGVITPAQGGRQAAGRPRSAISC